MSARDRASARAASIEQVAPELILQLERLLRGQLQGCDQLLDCLARKREALRGAEIDTIRLCCERERSLIAAIRELDGRRHALLKPLNSSARMAQAPSLAEIASRCGSSDDGQRLLSLAAELRERIGHVRRTSSVIGAAADALGRHVAGILQTVTGSFTGAKVYSRRGRMNLGSSTQLAVDVKS
jgi:hypothetical protein